MRPIAKQNFVRICQYLSAFIMALVIATQSATYHYCSKIPWLFWKRFRLLFSRPCFAVWSQVSYGVFKFRHLWQTFPKIFFSLCPFLCEHLTIIVTTTSRRLFYNWDQWKQFSNYSSNRFNIWIESKCRWFIFCSKNQMTVLIWLSDTLLSSSIPTQDICW